MKKRWVDFAHTVIKHDEQPSELCSVCTRKKLEKPASELCSACALLKHGKQPSKLWSPHNLLKYDEEPSKLCSRCSQIDLYSKWGFSHHNFEQLKASATHDHCPLCKLFLQSFCVSEILNNPSSNITVVPSSTGKRLGYKLQGHAEKLFDIVRGTGSNVFGTSSEAHDIGQNTTDFRLISPIPLDDGNVAVISQWLLSCSIEHDRCKQAPSTSSPTRLLDIRGPQLRLVSPREKNPRYAILSHCWGNSPRLVLTESTVELFHEKIDWSALPATFKDAITTSRKLGIDYVWIDSLCISQDSRIDWERECQNMGDYYKNAYLTVSALDSPDSQIGFLQPRNDLAVRLSAPNTWIRPSTRMSNIIFRESCLNKRGWALQERLLATRILHFSRDEVLWECLTCAVTESSFKEHHEPVDMSSLVTSEGQDFKRAALHLGPDPCSLSDGAFAAWYRIVKQFSRRALKYETDRLPAISGIARFIGERTGLTYSAGIWRQDSHGLVWCIDGPGDRVSNHSVIREHVQAVDVECPTWSWAKMKHSVSWRFYEQPRTGSEGDAKIMQPKIAPEPGDPYTVTQTAELTLEAIKMDVKCIPGCQEARKYLRGLRPPQPRYEISEHMRVYGEGLTLEIYHDGVMIGAGCYDNPEMAETMVECTAINIAERKDEWSSFQINYFLLVQRSPQENGALERIGMGMTRNKGFSVEQQEPEFFEKVFEGLPKQVIRLR
jgi:hypothetical protein